MQFLRAVRCVAGVGVACALAAGGLGGAAATPAAAATLEGTPWRLVTYAGPQGQQRPVLPGTEVTATFQGGRVSGSAGCNQYTAGYQLAQDTTGVIRFTQAASTQRFCAEPPGLMEQEGAYLQALGRVARYSLDGDNLTLRDETGGVLLVFSPQPQTPLEGTDWRAVNYNNGRGGLVSLINGTEITARFEGGRLSGSAGCNTYTGGFTLAGEAIRIAPPASTRRFCAAPAGVMEQEAEYLAALPTAQRYRIEGDRLTLQRNDGATVAIYTAPTPGPARAIPGQVGLPRTGIGPGVLQPAAFAVAAALGLLALLVVIWRSRRAGPPLAG